MVRYDSRFYEKIAENCQKVRYAVRSTKTVPRGKRYDTNRNGTIQYDTVRFDTVRYNTVRYNQYGTKRYGTVSAYTKNWSLNVRTGKINRGRVSAFTKKSWKTVKNYGTLCDRPKRSLAENGTVRYGTVRYESERYDTVRYETIRYG